MAMDEASSPRRRFHSYVRTVSACDDILERENAVLRAHVHDLTELLAAFDLCELQDGHLKAVRDRAFRRDIAPERELLQVHHFERWQQQEVLLRVLNAKQDVESDSGKTSKALDEISRVHERDLAFLRQRVDVLERDVGNLRQRNELLERPSGCPDTEAHQTAVDLDKEQDKRLGEATKTVLELQKKVCRHQKAVAAQLAESAVQQKQSSRYNKIAHALAEF
ncbi:hypothetical protein KRP22_005174 [Phytophthora ramorum]|uniref:Uncharacterized protein n=1 Tax=Phytophthora ramorum TaxID=164328 RepID=H3GXV7_PHYRM|nr:hypothetical protein KRP23_8192 [Phytophthora ramorum]KAH7497696.1 hypothetical protein KRP22_12758 [Phytophthora ramorum]